MDWKKHRQRRAGECHINLKGEGIVAEFEMGIVETGRQRVYAGHYIRVIGPDGQEWTGEDASSVREALRALDEEIGRDGGRLLCAGLHDGFRESGLSADTGYGYIDGYRGAVHMMGRPSLLLKDEVAVVLSPGTSVIDKA